MSTEVLGDMLVRYRADISDLTKNVKAAKSEMSSVAEVTDKSTKQMTSSFKNMSYETKKTNESSIRGLLDFGAKLGQTVFGVKALADSAIGLGQALIGPNASMEQTTVGFETLLGKGKKTQAFLNELQQFAAATPFEFPQLATDAEHMLAFGFNSKEVLPDLTAIGDALSAMGKSAADIDSVVTVFGQMKAAGKVNAQDMMQLTSQGIPAWKILAQSMHLSVLQVQDLSQKGLLPADKSIKALTSGMEKMFGGGMKAQATTFNGLLSTFQDNASAALRAFTGPLFDSAKQGLTKLGDLVSSPSFQQFAKTMGQDLASGLQKIGGYIGPVVTDIGGLIGWFRGGSAPAQAFTFAALALGGAILAIKIAGVVSDMKNFITSVPEMVAKMFLVQESAEGIAGAKGLGAISSEAANAEKAMATASSGMKLSLAGIVGGVAGVALLEILAAKWIRDNNIVPTVKAAGGGVDKNADWITHKNPNDAIKQATKDAKDLQDQINQDWKDMEALFNRYEGRHLGSLSDKLGLTKADSDLIYTRSKMDDLAKPLKLPSMVPFTSDIEKARLKAIELGKKLHDLDNPVVLSIGTRTVDAAIAKIMYLKSQKDDLGGGSSPIPHLASGGFIQSSGLAFVHAGETVVPAGGGATTSSAGGGEIHVHVYLDGREMTNQMMPRVVSNIRLTQGLRR